MALLASGLSTASPATPTIIWLYVIPLMIDRHRAFGKALRREQVPLDCERLLAARGGGGPAGGYPRGHRRHHPRRTGGQRPGIPDVGKGPLRRLSQRHFAAFSCPSRHSHYQEKLGQRMESGQRRLPARPGQYGVAPAKSLAMVAVMPRTTVGSVVMIPAFRSSLVIAVVKLLLPAYTAVLLTEIALAWM